MYPPSLAAACAALRTEVPAAHRLYRQEFAKRPIRSPPINFFSDSAVQSALDDKLQFNVTCRQRPNTTTTQSYVPRVMKALRICNTCAANSRCVPPCFQMAFNVPKRTRIGSFEESRRSNAAQTHFATVSIYVFSLGNEVPFTNAILAHANEEYKPLHSKAEAYELAKGRLSDGGQLDRKYFEYFSIEDFFKLETTNNKKKSTYLSKILID